MLTEREKFLMREAMKAATNYDYLEEWLNDVVDNPGHTVISFGNVYTLVAEDE